jgi:hypothetical protein
LSEGLEDKSKRELELSKKEIAVLTIPANAHGWVEFNATSLMLFWKSIKGKDNHGLAVDVHDKNDVPLDAKLMFYLQTCQAGKSVV